MNSYKPERGIPVFPSSHVIGGGGGAVRHQRRPHVWAINRGGLFSILAVDEAHRCVLIKLWECCVLWLIVFPFHPLSTIRTSVLLQYDMGPFISCLSNTKCNSMVCVCGGGASVCTCRDGCVGQKTNEQVLYRQWMKWRKAKSWGNIYFSVVFK